MTDDDLRRDDEYLDDEDDENEDDDEQVDRFQSRRPPVKPFSSTSGSSFGSGRDTSQLPGNRPGGFQSRYGSGSTSPFSSSSSSSSGVSRPGSPNVPGSSRPAFSPPGGVIGGRRDTDEDDDEPEERRDNRPAASSSGGLASRPGGIGTFRSSAPSGGDRPPERGSDRPASSSGGSRFGGFGSKPSSGGDKKPGTPARSSGGGIKQGVGGLLGKLPIGGDKKPGTPARSSSKGGGGGLFGNIKQRASGLTGKLPGRGEKKPASASRTSSGTFSSSGLGSRPAASSAPAARKDSKAGGKFPLRLPFLGKRDEKPRAASTREKIERASKAPRVDESGLTLDNKLDILGVSLLLGSLALFFSSMSSTKGQLTEAINTFLSQLLGVGAIAVPLAMFAVGVWLIVRHFGDDAPVIDPVRLFGAVLIYVGGLLTFQFIESFNPAYAGINLRNPEELRLQLEISYMLGRGGGWVGAELYYLLVTNIGEAGMVVSMLGLILIGAMLLLRITAAEVAIFFISLWRSFSDAQRRRAQTREARARLRAAELAAAAESRVSVSKPAAPELPGGASPALPAAVTSSAESTEEPRPIPITMGGRTITAFFEGAETPAAEGERQPASGNQPSIAARLFSAVPALGRSSGETKSGSRPAGGLRAGGMLGSLFNRGAAEKARAEGQSPPAQLPAASASSSDPLAAPAAAQASLSSPAASHETTAAAQADTGETTTQPQEGTVRVGDLMRTPGRASAFSRPVHNLPVTDDEDEDEDDEQVLRRPASQPGRTIPTPSRPEGRSSVWARPAAHAGDEPQGLSIEERRERLNAIRSGQAVRPFSGGRPTATDGERPDASPPSPQRPAASTARVTHESAQPSAAAPQRQPIVFRDTTDDQNGHSTATSQPAARPQPAPSPAFARPAGPPAAAPPPRKRRDWKLPDYRALLSAGSESDFDREVLLRQARTIEETLQSFGAPGRVVEVNTGPVITQFGVEPDYLVSRSGKKSRVKVGAIAQLDKDLQLALGAKSIRIEAPVPGKGYVGIEVPNEEASIVSLRDVMESEQFQKIKAKSALSLALGQSVDGTPVSADLAIMPHLLIAGTTGSGKSVLVNAIISCLLINNPPDRVKFIMVDPKRVELTGYNGIPHLVAPVVVDLERTVGVLKWVTREMDERYKQFSNAGARNIEDFNKHLPPDREPMPYIVVIIDELADLMMMAPDETERVITRIAALARATGIHLVIATQRPSVDVVTGLIKANFPARIAFAVAGGVDSRVILDQPGAERLLGRGDMLYLSGNSPAPLRLQGVWVSEQEINNITRYWKRQNADQPEPHIIKSLAVDDEVEEAREVQPASSNRFAEQAQAAFWDVDDDDDDLDLHDRVKDERDELYDQAVEMVRRLNKASVSLLQRRLRIGYTRAARLIDMMEAEGIVGPAQEGSKPREVLPQS